MANTAKDEASSLAVNRFMPRRIIITLAAHFLCLAPLLWLVSFCTSARLFLDPDPVKFITHFTGRWAIYILLASFSVSLIGRFARGPSRLTRFRRLTLLYAFVYTTLHLAIYLFVYSGYDLLAAVADLRIGHLGALIGEWNAVTAGVFDDLSKRLFIDVGLLGWVILLLAVMSSHGFSRRAPGGRKSQVSQRLIYAASIAALIHFLWFLKTDTAKHEGRCSDTPAAFLHKLPL